MDPEVFQIKIESILGGHSASKFFSGQNEYQASLSINPSLPSDGTEYFSSGLLAPSYIAAASGTLNDKAMWILSEPKGNDLYVYDARGSVYTLTGGQTLTDISDGGSMSNSDGNGAAYYDNYMYFAKDTTVARYGPLNGTPLFDGNYWTTTLGKTALTDTTYPSSFNAIYQFPNHVMHRHSDGKLYFADVVDNKGTIHVISTRKTTVEGDTDDGSTYTKVQVGYGLYISAIESYGSGLVFALFEGQTSVPAKLAFWDTTSQKINTITLSEFTDPFISSLKNVNGELYIVSGQAGGKGFRLTKYIGGNSVGEVGYFRDSYQPATGGVVKSGTNLWFGTYHEEPTAAISIFAYGIPIPGGETGFFNIASSTNVPSNASCHVSALAAVRSSGDSVERPVFAWIDGGSEGIDYQNTVPGTNTPIWRSRLYNIGRPFKITKIRIPLIDPVGSGHVITPKIYVDNESSTYTLQTINNSNFSGKRNIVLRSGSAGEVLTGQQHFFLELEWDCTFVSGTSFVVSLPIIIEYELLDD